jgi:hypothetical protein
MSRGRSGSLATGCNKGLACVLIINLERSEIRAKQSLVRLGRDSRLLVPLLKRGFGLDWIHRHS